MEVGALQTDPARTGEAVEHQVAGPAAEKAGLEPVDLLGHRDRVVAVDPAAGLDVDRLPRLERLLEHVAVAVHPDHALVVAGEELVHEEAAAVEHVGEALDPAVVVLDVAGGGQELVLAHDDPVAGLQVQAAMWPGASRLKAISPGDCASSSSSGMPPNTRRLSPLRSGCRPIWRLGYFHSSTWCSKYTGTWPSRAMCRTGHELALEAVAEARARCPG